MKKSILYDRAEQLYTEEQWTYEAIAKELECSDRTLRNWAKEGRWELKRTGFMEQHQNLHQDARDIAELLAKKIKGQLKDDKIPAAHMLNAFTRMATTLLNAQKYERELNADLCGDEDRSKDKEAAIALFRDTFGIDLTEAK